MASKRFVQHFSVSCAHELSEAIMERRESE